MNYLRRLTKTTVLRDRKKFYNHESLARCESTVEMPPVEKMQPKCKFSIPTCIVGQPTCYTHPHLIEKDYLTPYVTQTEYADRRENLVNKLASESQNSNKSHIIIIPAACKQYMSDKIPYMFRQNSDFYYLTGCLEPSAILVMIKPAHCDYFKSIMFVHDKDSHAELWEGPRTGCAQAANMFGVEEARPVENFNTYLNKTISSSQPAVLWYHNESPANPEIHSTVRAQTSRCPSLSVGDPQRALHLLRVIKSPAEIALMEDTCRVGAHAMNMAMSFTKPGVTEHSISAVLEYTARCAGAEHAAFPPVVAGAARATHIHYVANSQQLTEHDMLLVDSGSQKWLYNSDISRTWPVSGKFSKYHRILYELVLSVQKRLIEILGDQRPPLDQLFEQMCRLLGTQLQNEGILPRNIDTHELIGKAYRLCPHHVSHYLGLDVHDTPLVRRHVPVQDNMIVTVEPGVYIRADDTSVPAEFRGCGVRVEDDVLLTSSGPIILTADAVKEVDDIEAIVGKNA